MVSTATYAADSQAQMQADFGKKSQILASRFPALPPEMYLEELFGCSAELRVMNFVKAEPGKRIRVVDGLEHMLSSDIVERKDAFYYAADFFKPYPRKQLLKNMYALIVDLDAVSPDTVGRLINEDFWGLRPTYVVNSGHGLHIVYAFDAPVNCYDWAKIQLEKLYDKLKQHFVSHKCCDIQYVVDYKISILQSYRMPGTLTKVDTVCTAYRSGRSWTPEKLAASVGISWNVRRPTPHPPTLSTPKQSAQNGKRGDVSYLPNTGKGFYEKTKDRMIRETPVGRRYYSMFALAIIAYKCRVPLEKLERDLEFIRDSYNNRDQKAHKVKTSEVSKAIGGYNPKAITVKRSTLCNWLGFEYDAAKRNGRTRAEHLAGVHRKRSNEAQTKVAKYFEQHPEASNAQAVRELGVSKHTVIKYRHEAEATLNDQPKEEHTQTVTQPKTINEITSRIVVEADKQKRAKLIALLPPNYQAIVIAWGIP